MFANIYLNELDKFIKHVLKVKHYLRYTDDFIIVHNDPKYLEDLILKIQAFLLFNLNLKLHPRKIIIRKLSQGIDFLGYVVLPHHRVLRTKTKRRMFRKAGLQISAYEKDEISRKKLDQTLQSYFGMLKHSRSRGIRKQLKIKLTQI